MVHHVWLSDSAAQRKVAARINRRTRLGGDGSYHDPAWVEADLSDPVIRRSEDDAELRQLPRTD